MRETTVLCEVVCGAEPVGAPNGADFALRCDDELCAHDGESRTGVFDASESYGHTRRARRVGYIAVIGSEGRSSSVGLPVTLRRNSTKFGHRSRVDLESISMSITRSRCILCICFKVKYTVYLVYLQVCMCVFPI